jgi:hypothetical protein
MRSFLAAVAVASIALALPAHASDTGIKGTGRYGVAGCGLGSLAFGDTPGAVQVIAATLNGTGVQTFGITTGTSNCGAGIFAQGTKNFVEANREAVAKDISRGEGEAIGALSVINACSDSHKVGAALKKNFGQIFPNDDVSSDEVTKAILETLHKDPSLGCGNG